MAVVIDWESARQRCLSEASEADEFAISKNHFNRDLGRVGTHRDTVKHFAERYETESSVRWHLQTVRGAMNEETQRLGRPEPYSVFNLCLLEAVLTQMGRSGTPPQKKSLRSGDESAARTERSSEVGDVNQSIALAQQNQAKGEEQARKDKRRRNYPELEASQCLMPVIRSGFSGFKNNCPFSVRYTYCVESPERGTGAAFVDCNKQSGAGTVPANGEDFAHMKGGDGVHHVACKLPGTAITRKFENGRLWADCAKLGGD